MRFNIPRKIALMLATIFSASGCLFATEGPYIPGSDAVSIRMTNIGESVKALVTVTLPTPCHEVGSWGNPVRTGSTISANAQFWVDPEVFCIQIIWDAQNEYDLGPLPPGAYQFVFEAWGQPLVTQSFSVGSRPPAQAFYRMAAANPTVIVALDARGLLTATSSVPNLPFTLQSATNPRGPWTSDLSYSVIANAGGEMAALVPLGSQGPAPACCRSEIVARVRNVIPMGPGMCQVDAYVWRNLMPGPGPRPGVLANITVAGLNGVPVAASAAITRLWLINGTEVWDVPPPYEPSLSPPGVLSTTVRNGPLWEPGTRVDVVVQVSVGRVNYLLRTANVPIGAAF